MKKALIIIDTSQAVTRNFSYASGPVTEGINKIGQLITHCAEKGELTIFVNMPGDRTLEQFTNRANNPSFFYKNKYSAFTNPHLDDHLENHNIDTLIIGGYVRHVCVLATVKSALERKYRVITSNDIMFGYSVSQDGTEDKYGKQAQEKSLRYYKENTLFVPTMEGILLLI